VIKFSSIEGPTFLYRISLQGLGRSLELGISYDELTDLKAKAERLFSLPTRWFKKSTVEKTAKRKNLAS
jgi:hypothetical protein